MSCEILTTVAMQTNQAKKNNRNPPEHITDVYRVDSCVCECINLAWVWDVEQDRSDLEQFNKVVWQRVDWLERVLTLEAVDFSPFTLNSCHVLSYVRWEMGSEKSPWSVHWLLLRETTKEIWFQYQEMLWETLETAVCTLSYGARWLKSAFMGFLGRFWLIGDT